MKKIFTSKKCLLLPAVALLAVSCFKLSSVSLSSHDVEAGKEVTLTANVENAHWENVPDNSAFAFFGVRVPADWSVTSVSAVNTVDDGTSTDIESEPSDYYTALLDHCYPRVGYKWLGFQTNKEKFTLKQNSTDRVVVTANLKAGFTTGDFNLDVVMGSSTTEAIEDLYTKNEDGTYNFSKTLNDLNDDGTPKGSTVGYVFETGTISDLENYVQYQEMSKNNEYPSIVNRLNIESNGVSELAITVKPSTTGIVAAEADAEAVEVVAGEGCVNVAAACGVAAVYNAAGVMTDSKAIANGSATLRAHKGVCLVQIANGAGKVVKKVVVK